MCECCSTCSSPFPVIFLRLLHIILAAPYDNQHPGDYAEEDWVAAFLNSPSTQAALGVDKLGPGDSRDGTFVGCSDKVYKHFASTGDGARDSTWAVRDVLEKGVRVLAYSGESRHHLRGGAS